MKLKRNGPGVYELPNGHQWIIKTEWDGPKGGTRYIWELLDDDKYGPVIRNEHGPWTTLREARAVMAEVLAAS
jgi:hypothetical protein